MQTYLVGGAVRDQLLNRPVKERDWVVVGSSAEEMKAKGFQQVGKDFPVFLHPKTKEEYALARTERKNGVGYTGFDFDVSADVTLTDDLLRRDLTVNAIAMDENGELIDPYNGQADLQNRVLRHVSDAFSEDPLRVLRVARFAARYAPYQFSIAPETMSLMKSMVTNGELAHLSPQRVWKETARSLMEDNPQIYFEVLRECGALEVWFPELNKLWGIPNPKKWHPEIDTGIHTMMVLQKVAGLSDKLPVRFAALVHDLGKGLTPAEKWPSHHGHEKLGLTAIIELCERLTTPNDCKELAMLVSEFHSHVHRAFDLKSSTILQVFNRTDAWRKEQRFLDLLTTCKADARGRLNFENDPYHQESYFISALNAAKSVDVKSVVAAGYQGAKIKEELNQRRIKTIQQLKNSQTTQI